MKKYPKFFALTPSWIPILDSTRLDSTSIHQFHDSTLTRLRLQSFGISLENEPWVGTLISQVWLARYCKQWIKTKFCTHQNQAFWANTHFFAPPSDVWDILSAIWQFRPQYECRCLCGVMIDSILNSMVTSHVHIHMADERTSIRQRQIFDPKYGWVCYGKYISLHSVTYRNISIWQPCFTLPFLCINKCTLIWFIFMHSMF